MKMTNLEYHKKKKNIRLWIVTYWLLGILFTTIWFSLIRNESFTEFLLRLVFSFVFVWGVTHLLGLIFKFKVLTDDINITPKHYLFEDNSERNTITYNKKSKNLARKILDETLNNGIFKLINDGTRFRLCTINKCLGDYEFKLSDRVDIFNKVDKKLGFYFPILKWYYYRPIENKQNIKVFIAKWDETTEKMIIRPCLNDMVKLIIPKMSKDYNVDYLSIMKVLEKDDLYLNTIYNFCTLPLEITLTSEFSDSLEFIYEKCLEKLHAQLSWKLPLKTKEELAKENFIKYGK